MKNGQQVGPFSYDELWNQKISANTLVWFEGMNEWKPAYTIPEFGNWFQQQTQVNPNARPQARRPTARPIPQQPIKQKKSKRGVIGIVVFLVGCVIIYIYWANSTGNMPDATQQVITKKKGAKSKQNNLAITLPEFGNNYSYTKDNYPLNPNQFGNEIAEFLGTVRVSFPDAKLYYMDPLAEERFQFLLDTYSERALQTFFIGVVPSVKYQSPTSSLVLFYNPWNDLVLITDWHLIEGQLLIMDMELVSADYLKYDGVNIGQLVPLWARNREQLPIEALTDQAEQREELFEETWGEPTGKATWRKVQYSLSSPELLIQDQQVVAFRLRDQLLSLQYLIKDTEMKVLLEPFIADIKLLHSPSNLGTLLAKGLNTPDIVAKNMALFPADTWEKASVQQIQKVPEGAFVFVTSPRLTKTFLSFYYTFGNKKELRLNRIDWCTFDNEL